MFEFRSLETRVAALSIAAFGLVLTLVALAMQLAIENNAEDRARADLEAGSRIINQLWDMRLQELESAAEPLGRDFGFRGAVATGDTATIRSALRNIAGRIELPDAFVVNYDGSLIGRTAQDDREFDAALWDQLDNGWESGVLRVGDKTLQAVATEIRAPSLIGWLVIGRELDQESLVELSQFSAIPVHAKILRETEPGAWMDDSAGMAIADAELLGMLDTLARRQAGNAAPLSQRVDGTVSLVRPLGETNGRNDVALELDFAFEEALKRYDSLRLTVLLTGFAGLLMVALAARWMARRITRPIATLEQASDALANGERTKVPVQSQDEIGRLSRQFNRMSRKITEREQRISHLAYHDPLTDLPNRYRLEEEIGARIERDGELALLCFGIDGFKMINDTLGHVCGDNLLQALAHRLQEGFDGQFLARMGSDQFCLLASDGEEADTIASEVSRHLKRPFLIGEHRLQIGVSTGICRYPEDSARRDDLLKHTELAMFHAKEIARGGAVRFTSDLDRRASAKREIEADLHVAISEGQFEVYFQPLYDLASNRFSSFEALVRWNHPNRGMVSPVEFIPIAEECGLIIPIGEWVLKEACHQASSWPEDIRVAVNFSPIQFHSEGLPNIVFQSLSQSGLAPQRLEVEITESLFLDESQAILDTLRSFKAMGVRIALDDFGTGYSSLSYLRKFPFDKLKIDRSFITELLDEQQAADVVRAITSLASALDMETTAEGVEEAGQVELLRKFGCTSVQGFHFGRPVPASSVHDLLQQDHQRRA